MYVCVYLSEFPVIQPARQFSRTLTSYHVYLRKSRRKLDQFNACAISTGRLETPSRSLNIEDIFGKENSAVTPSRCSTLRRHMFVPLCLIALTSLSTYSLAMLFFHLFYGPALYLSLPTPLTKGSSGAWSILLMVHTRVVVDLGSKNRAASSLVNKRM